MGNGKNDAKAGKQKQQLLLIFGPFSNEWVGQGPDAADTDNIHQQTIQNKERMGHTKQ